MTKGTDLEENNFQSADFQTWVFISLQRKAIMLQSTLINWSPVSLSVVCPGLTSCCLLVCLDFVFWTLYLKSDPLRNATLR